MSIDPLLPLFLALAMLTTAPGHAQTPQPQTGQDPYAVCNDGLQDQEACRKEVARTRNISVNEANETEANLRSNALRRCAAHSDAQDKAACEDRILGIDNTQSQGSVMGGGVIRRQTLPGQVP